MKTVTLPSGEQGPALGMGAWNLGDRVGSRSEEMATLQHGIDLYLLHWRRNVPLKETVSAFEKLQREGKIRYWGVSNFAHEDMAELKAVPGGHQAAVNQVLYNVACRGIEWDLQPWCRDHHIPIMAYSPIEQGRLLNDPDLCGLAGHAV